MVADFMTKQTQRPTPKTRPLPHPLRQQHPRPTSETPDHYELLEIEVFPGTSTLSTRGDGLTRPQSVYLCTFDTYTTNFQTT